MRFIRTEGKFAVPVIFSASPPTNTVLQPQGRSLVVGNGA